MYNFFYRSRKLPHLQPPGGTFFITSRLYGSIPKPVINKLKAQYQQELAVIEKEYCGHLPNPDFCLSADLQTQLFRIKKKKENLAGVRYFGRFDQLLDSGLNEPHWFRNASIARLTADAIHFYDGKHYDLHTFTIMSNHVHLLLTMRSGAPMLWKVLGDLKRYTGVHCNRLLGQEGHFWEEESYDHLVREGEFFRIQNYILENPVKAGVVRCRSEYQWNYTQ